LHLSQQPPYSSPLLVTGIQAQERGYEDSSGQPGYTAYFLEFQERLEIHLEKGRYTAAGIIDGCRNAAPRMGNEAG
jgi:hypothetical protein